MNDYDALTDCSHIDSPRDTASALSSHLPESTLKMLDLRLMDLLKAVHLNQVDDTLKARSEIAGKSVQHRLHAFV
jgi:hypothetical protein